MISDHERLQHMLSACDDIIAMGNTELWSRTERLAAERCIEIIGVAAKHLSEELTKKYSEIEWQDIVGMRNILAHEYFRTQEAIVKQAARIYVPHLRCALFAILEAEYD